MLRDLLKLVLCHIAAPEQVRPSGGLLARVGVFHATELRKDAPPMQLLAMEAGVVIALNGNHIDELRAVFAELDVDGSGTLDMEEMTQLAKRFYDGREPTMKQSAAYPRRAANP